MDVLWRAFGNPNPPNEITQEAWDCDEGHLRRLARLRPGERANGKDLWAYTQDLQYTEIQGPLLLYVLPFCLNAWRDDLRGVTTEYGGFVEWFYPVLANCRIFDVFLNSEQGAAVSTFMRESILREIDNQRGLSFKGAKAPPCRWIGALITYGVLRPDIESLWNGWWSLGNVGRAVAAVQFISCLMYQEYENPVFAPWTSNEGGGPPVLWEFEGHLYTHRWMQPNVAFLKTALAVATVTATLKRAVDSLAGQNEHGVASEILGDVPLCMETLEARASELPQLLATTQDESTPLEWSK
jgi:hypothetical protein